MIQDEVKVKSHIRWSRKIGLKPREAVVDALLNGKLDFARKLVENG